MLRRQSIYSIALATALLTAGAPARAHDESKYPDWSGQWIKVPDGGPPRYDPSKPDGTGQQAPLKEPYRRMHEASMADQAAGGQVPADRSRRDGGAVVMLQVPADRVRPGVQTAAGRSLRSRTITPAVSPLIAPGDVFGRRDLGSNAASPSA